MQRLIAPLIDGTCTLERGRYRGLVSVTAGIFWVVTSSDELSPRRGVEISLGDYLEEKFVYAGGDWEKSAKRLARWRELCRAVENFGEPLRVRLLAASPDRLYGMLWHGLVATIAYAAADDHNDHRLPTPPSTFVQHWLDGNHPLGFDAADRLILVCAPP